MRTCVARIYLGFEQIERPVDMAPRDLYATLGVPESASAEEVRRAFHARALRCHPDKGGDARAFQELQAAYATLGDASSRCAYDARVSAECKGIGSEEEACGFGCFAAAAAAFGGGGKEAVGSEDDDVFETVFDASDPFCGPAFVFAAACGRDNDDEEEQGDGPRRPSSPPPPPPPPGTSARAPVSVRLPLEQVRHGCPALPVDVGVSEACPGCSSRRPCPTCSGTGTRLHVLGSTLAIRAPCSWCGGSGLRNRGRLGCARCADVGRVTRCRRVAVRVPPGPGDGHVVALDVVDDDAEGKDGSPFASRVWVRVTYSPARGESVVPDGSGDVVVRVPLHLGEALTGRFREGDVKTVAAMGRQIRLMAPRAYRDPTVPVVLSGGGLPSAASSASASADRLSAEQQQKQLRYGDLRLVFDVQWPSSSSHHHHHHDDDDESDDSRRRVVRNLNKYADVLGKICCLPTTGGGGGEGSGSANAQEEKEETVKE